MFAQCWELKAIRLGRLMIDVGLSPRLSQGCLASFVALEGRHAGQRAEGPRHFFLGSESAMTISESHRVPSKS